jgi:hypothetical protein
MATVYRKKHLLASDPTAHYCVYFSVHVIVPQGLNGAKKENTGSTNGTTLSLMMSIDTVCGPMRSQKSETLTW